MNTQSHEVSGAKTWTAPVLEGLTVDLAAIASGGATKTADNAKGNTFAKS